MLYLHASVSNFYALSACVKCSDCGLAAGTSKSAVKMTTQRRSRDGALTSPSCASNDGKADLYPVPSRSYNPARAKDPASTRLKDERQPPPSDGRRPMG